MKGSDVMRHSFLILLAFFCVSFFLSEAHSAESVKQGTPLEITADESLEWNRNEKYFKARKNVIAVQGQTALRAALLTALYAESGEKNVNIHTIEAEGSVRIDSGESRAYGDKATYDVKKGYAVLRGKNLKLESPDQTVTAQERMEYWVNKGELQAIGRAKAVREGDTLVADKIIALFKEDSKGQRALKSLEAIGNVVITTPDEVLTGQRALYSADTNLAELSGDVKITRGPNVLEGDKAEVDLNTNISRMFGSQTNGGRVRGVFYPGSEDLKPDGAQQ